MPTNLYAWRHGQTPANLQHLTSGGAPELMPAAVDWRGITSLTEEGQQQARKLGEMVVGKCTLDVIYTSDLSRAQDTANAVVQAYKFKGHSVELHNEPQLREVLHGKYDFKPVKERNLAALPMLMGLLEKEAPQSNDKFLYWKVHPLAPREEFLAEEIVDVQKYIAARETRPEVPMQLFNRTTAALKKIAQTHPGKQIGISTHGAVLAALIDGLNTDFKGTHIPPYYSEAEIKVGDKVLPAASKIQNCALIHFRYHPNTGELTHVKDEPASI